MSREAVAALAESAGELAVGPMSGTYRRPAHRDANVSVPAPIPLRASAGAALSIDSIGYPYPYRDSYREAQPSDRSQDGLPIPVTSTFLALA